ncbi:cyclic-phosphate processing receiver domain-containing protein [Paenibacillus sp. SI8]|uniref:cyclic-phosphate processing receiver domain-containing protein n=1 Tax=unclassified Paenibacillus TaxID=185978 RepID=UPI0034656276
MIHVYLDDLRPCPQGFTLARTADECKLILESCDVDILSLDHDLGWGSQHTGMDVVIWMVQQQIFPRTVYIHTSSPSACTNMFQMLNHAKPPEMRLFPNRLPDDLLWQIAHETRASG